ncbi:MAG TPA: enoyl-CoA hydratase-related protein, partial [Deinococcales bacterium]|nr:enoyl-CoA hydratase-related protein [Deinococcales bacterium]
MTTSPATDTVLTRLENGVLWVTMNRPDSLNSCNDELLHGLQDAFRAAERDPAVRAIVLTGAGRGFCSGQDLRDVAGRGTGFRRHLLETYNPIILKMRSIEKPVITAV